MRTNDQRFLPAVGGIDLEQSLNYIALDDVTLDFIYDKYTGARLVYQAGARPVLDGAALCRALTETLPNLPVILMTGQAPSLFPLDDLPGQPIVLRKPIDQRALRAAIADTLARVGC